MSIYWWFQVECVCWRFTLWWWSGASLSSALLLLPDIMVGSSVVIEWTGTSKLKPMEPASEASEYTSPLYLPCQSHGQMIWASYLISSLESFSHLHRGWYLLFVLLNGHDMASSSVELTSWCGISRLRPWNSLSFYDLFQIFRWVPKVHLPKSETSMFFLYVELARMFLYSFIQCYWSSCVSCFV